MPEVVDVQHDETAEREEQERSAPGASEPRPAAPLAPMDERSGAITSPVVEPLAVEAPVVERMDLTRAARVAAPIGRDHWVRETVTLGLTGETYRLESRIARPRRFGRLPRWASVLALAFVVILSTLACVAALQAERFGRDLLRPPAATAPAGTPHASPVVPHK